MIGALFDPEKWWSCIEPKLDKGGALPILLAIALAGGLNIALATEIGVRNFNTDWHYVAGYGLQPDRGWAPFLGLWAVAAGGPFVQGVISAWLLKLYARPRQWVRPIAVAVIGSIPTYIAGLSLILLPGILIVVVAFLVSCAWWSSGSRTLLGVIDADSAEYVAVSLVLSGALVLLLSASMPL